MRHTLSQCSRSQYDTLGVINWGSSAAGLRAHGVRFGWERLVRHESARGVSLTRFALLKSRTVRTAGTLIFTSLCFRRERRPRQRWTRYVSFGLTWSRKNWGPTMLQTGRGA